MPARSAALLRAWPSLKRLRMERCERGNVVAGHLCKETSMASPTRGSSPQAQQGPSRGKSFIGAMLIASAIALVLIVYARQAHRSPSTTESQPASSQTTGSSKRAESPPAQPQEQTSQPQTSPQGETGPLETSSGGAPAASPQGETPPGMQSAPGGSAAKDPKPD
jgi:hypothetical protein